jgi:hypothetical protein
MSLSLVEVQGQNISGLTEQGKSGLHSRQMNSNGPEFPSPAPPAHTRPIFDLPIG